MPRRKGMLQCKHKRIPKVTKKYQGNPLQQSIEALLMHAYMMEYVVKLSV